MDPFELMLRRPIPVKSSATNSDFDFDEGLIDRVLGKPDKIEIPERYIPEEEQFDPDEQQKRTEKAEAICRLLTKSTSAGVVPLVLPNPGKHHRQLQHHLQQRQQQQQQKHHQEQQQQQHYKHHHHDQQQVQPQHHKQTSYGSYGSNRSLNSATNITTSSRPSAAEVLGVNPHGIPLTPSRRPVVSSSPLKKASSSSRINNRHPSRNSLVCDWSLAGVSAPTSPQ